MNKDKLTNIEKEMLEAAYRIGLKICSQSIWYEGKCNWLGRTVDDAFSNSSRKMVVVALGPDVYAGTSGISLFLAYLFIFTKNEIFKKHAKGAISQSIMLLKEEYSKNIIRYGFYNGFIGVAYIAAQIGDLFKDKELIDESLKILLNLYRDKNKFKNNQGNDIISGNAGSIPALLDLHLNIFPRTEIIDLAVYLGNDILSSAIKDNTGYSWDAGIVRAGKASHNLTGFAHGAAGIGYSLLELYNQTKGKAFLDGATNAFRYENHWFNENEDNWPDFRINTNQNKHSDDEYGYGTAWCHGAPGIGLTRLRAIQLLGSKNKRYENDIAASIRIATELINNQGSSWSTHNYSLCHGLSGIAELLLFSDSILHSNYRNILLKMYKNANKEYNANNGTWRCGIPIGETPDLLVGLSGIGYFYLRLYKPKEIPSILFITPTKTKLD